MRNSVKKVFSLLIIAFLTSSVVYSQNSPGFANLHNLDPYNPDFAKGVVLVKFKDEVPIVLQKTKSSLKTGINTVDDFISRHKVITLEKVFANEEKREVNKSMTTPDGQTHEVPQLFNIYKFKADANEDVKKMVEELKSDPLVDFAEPDYYFYSQATEPNDPMASQQWYLGAFPGVNAKAAWDTTTGDTTQIIGIIDTGVDWAHPDLAPNIWRNWGEIPGNGIDDDGNGKIDDVRGWDFVNNDNNPMDDNSHGTHVAGIAAAKGNNSIGIAGIAWNAKIMPIKVMQSSGYGSASDIANGINYARLKGATILNLSLGSYGESFTLKTALENAYSTAVIVAAAGNDGYKIDPPFPPAPLYAPHFPACYSWVIGVQATTQTGELASFSNFDPSGPIDYTNAYGHNYEMRAPGVGILSTFPGGGYHLLNGTSMASPVVAGGVALIKSHRPAISTEELFAILIQSSSGGNLNIFAALNHVLVPNLKYVSNTIVDTLTGDDRDGKGDAGETIQLFLKVKNAGGSADSVWTKLRFAPFEDTTVATILDSTSFIGTISTYGTMTGQTDPFKIYIKPTVANNRDIMFQYEIGSKDNSEVTSGTLKITITNGVELGGHYYGTKHLTQNKLYLVTSNTVFDTLKIDPGTRIQISDEKSIFVSRKMICNGKPDSMIVFTQNGSGYWLQIKNVSGNPQQMKYCVFEYFGVSSSVAGFPTHIDGFRIHNSIFRYGKIHFTSVLNSDSITKCLFFNNFATYMTNFGNINIFQNNIISGNTCTQWDNPTFLNSGMSLQLSRNFRNNSIFSNDKYNLSAPYPASWGIFKLSPIYWGTTDSLTIEHSIYDFFENSTFPIVDGFDSAQATPSAFCHGHVWKILIDSVEINKYDHPYSANNGRGIVGLGIHKFDVYFNRPMDASVTPFLTFGVREPYTQKIVAESASWSSDFKRWTAYFNIGIETGDGVQRVRVAMAQDNDHFEIPIENSRFEFVIQAAGSASIEFMATPGIGKVGLEWNRAGTEDAMGYNMYRQQNITDTTFSSPIRINTTLITDTLYTDYAVLPNNTYHYYYKVVGTDLAESDSSKKVTATPLNAANGDANGDGLVNVLDITTVISYMLSQNPQPFLFDAADVNNDNAIDILDVIGIVNLINGKKKAGSIFTGTNPDPAYICLDSNAITFRSQGQVAALQLELTGKNIADIELMCKQNGFEFAQGVVKGKLTGILYNMNNHTLPGNGNNPLTLLSINNKQNLDWGEVKAGDIEGNKVIVIKSKGSYPDDNNFNLQAHPNPFTQAVTINFNLPEESKVEIKLYDIQGKLVSVLMDKELKEGLHWINWNGTDLNNHALSSGTYFCKLEGQAKSGNAFHKEIKLIYTK